MAANLTETAIRGLKTKSTAYYVGATVLNVVLAGLALRFSLLAAKFFISVTTLRKGRKRFIQLGIWPEMKLVTANELAKSMVRLVEGKEPQQRLEQQRPPNSTLCSCIVLTDRLKNWCMVTSIR